jgi:hypothetical protein
MAQKQPISSVALKLTDMVLLVSRLILAKGLSPDVYTVYFFDDLNDDGTPDPAGAESSADASIPCR